MVNFTKGVTSENCLTLPRIYRLFVSDQVRVRLNHDPQMSSENTGQSDVRTSMVNHIYSAMLSNAIHGDDILLSG